MKIVSGMTTYVRIYMIDRHLIELNEEKKQIHASSDIHVCYQLRLIPSDF